MACHAFQLYTGIKKDNLLFIYIEGTNDKCKTLIQIALIYLKPKNINIVFKIKLLKVSGFPIYALTFSAK